MESSLKSGGRFSLVACGSDGRPAEPIEPLAEELESACLQSAKLYERIGYEPPWVSYVATLEGRGVGGGAFVGAPKEGCVEIAYFTVGGQQGLGHATRTARALVEIARTTNPDIEIKAFTLPERNASVRILERLGFKQVGEAQDEDAGRVWEWRLLRE